MTPAMSRPAAAAVPEAFSRPELGVARGLGGPDGAGLGVAHEPEVADRLSQVAPPAVRRAFPPLRAAQQRLDICRYVDPVAVLAVTAALALWSGWAASWVGTWMSVGDALALAVVPWGTVVGLRVAGMYDAGHYLPLDGRRALRLTVGLAGATLLAALLGLAVARLAGGGGGTLAGENLGLGLAALWGGALAAVAGARLVVLALTTPLAAADVQHVIVVGTGPRAVRLYRERYAALEDHVELVGLVTPTGGTGEETAAPALGTLEELEEILARRSVDEVLIALPVRLCYAEIQQALEACARVGVPAMYIDDVFATPSGAPNCRFANGMSLVRMRVAPEDHRVLAKRAIDLIVSVVGLTILSPVLVLTALAIKLTSRGPVIFRQERYGLNRRRFTIYKFRTMVTDAEQQQDALEQHNEADGPLFKIRDDPRMTPVGRLLRRTSIDEVPQLFNVVLGNMSLVGPRPLPMRDVDRFPEPYLMRRFSVLPGVTGLWQVSGRSQLGFDDCVRHDLDYIDRWSLGLDLRILLRTVPAVLHGHGAA